jgi:hypothetical protein
MTHPYTKYLICRDDYFDNPEHVIELSKHMNYSRSTFYPGERTGNLLGMEDKKIKEFADWFADRLSFDIFPGIRMFELMLCFHRNFPNKDPYYNRGLIHNDWGNLAGLIYLTPGEHDLNTGTSIFDNDTLPRTEPCELDTDAAALKEFYLYDNTTPDYVKGFEHNLKIFESGETIRVGNKFNRLIAYDAKLWHRPNSFATSVDQPRLSLLFFVSQFSY